VGSAFTRQEGIATTCWRKPRNDKGHAGSPEGVKNCEFNKNLKMKNVLFEVSEIIMRIADKK
jgi:hypothetical protein